MCFQVELEFSLSDSASAKVLADMFNKSCSLKSLTSFQSSSMKLYILRQQQHMLGVTRTKAV